MRCAEEFTRVGAREPRPTLEKVFAQFKASARFRAKQKGQRLRRSFPTTFSQPALNNTRTPVDYCRRLDYPPGAEILRCVLAALAVRSRGVVPRRAKVIHRPYRKQYRVARWPGRAITGRPISDHSARPHRIAPAAPIIPALWMIQFKFKSTKHTRTLWCASGSTDV
jgi:hypothetical protein